MKNKIYSFICILVVCSVIYLFTYPFYRYYTSPEKDVYIEWRVYTPTGPVIKKGTYKMRGETFRTMCYSDKNGVHCKVVRDNSFGPFISNESTCVYSGFNDCDILKVEVLEEN